MALTTKQIRLSDSSEDLMKEVEMVAEKLKEVKMVAELKKVAEEKDVTEVKEVLLGKRRQGLH